VSHTRHSCTDHLHQRVYQIAAGYEDWYDANELRKDPALRLALGKKYAYPASQSVRPPLSGGEGYLLDDGFCDFAFGSAQNDRVVWGAWKSESFHFRETNRKEV